MEESSLAVAGKLLCLLPRRPCCASSFISPVHKTRACEEHKAPWCSLTWKPCFLSSILIHLTTDALQRHLYGVTLSLPHETQFYHSLFPNPYSHTVRKGAVECWELVTAFSGDTSAFWPGLICFSYRQWTEIRNAHTEYPTQLLNCRRCPKQVVAHKKK